MGGTTFPRMLRGGEGGGGVASVSAARPPAAPAAAWGVWNVRRQGGGWGARTGAAAVQRERATRVCNARVQCNAVHVCNAMHVCSAMQMCNARVSFNAHLQCNALCNAIVQRNASVQCECLLPQRLRVRCSACVCKAMQRAEQRGATQRNAAQCGTARCVRRGHGAALWFGKEVSPQSQGTRCDAAGRWRCPHAGFTAGRCPGVAAHRLCHLLLLARLFTAVQRGKRRCRALPCRKAVNNLSSSGSGCLLQYPVLS